MTETKETTTSSTPYDVVKTTTTTPAVKTEHPQQVFNKKKTIFRTYQIIWFLLAIVEILLGFRMTLKAVGANPLSDFTNLIYSLSAPLAYPFSGILRTTVFENSIYEWSTIVAAVVYALLAYGITRVLQFFKPVTPAEVEKNVV